jgi:HEAT repeat protein
MSNEKAGRGRAPVDLRRPLEKLLREFHAASRIFSLYPLGHVALEEAVERPYRRFQEVFTVNKSIFLEIRGPDLIVEGCYFRSSTFVTNLLADLDVFGVKNLRFRDTLTKDDLYSLLSILKLKEEETSRDLGSLLRKKGVGSIEVNVTVGGRLRAEAGLSGLSSTVSDILEERPEELATLLAAGEDQRDQAATEILGFDVHGEAALQSFADKIKNLPQEKAARTLRRLVGGLELKGLAQKQRAEAQKTLVELFSSGRDQVTLLRPLLQDFLSKGWERGEIIEHLQPESLRKWNLLDGVERLASSLEDAEREPIPEEEFRDLIQGLVSLGSWERLSEIIAHTAGVLQRGAEEQKQEAFEHLVGVIDSVTEAIPESFLVNLTHHIHKCYYQVQNKSSRMIVLELVKRLILLDRLRSANEALSVLGEQTRLEDVASTTQEGEQGESKDQQVIERLIAHISAGQPESAKYAVDLILALGNDQAFKRLTDIFTSPNKSVRMASLKALRSGGEAAFRACQLLLKSKELEGADSGEGHLPDEQWYKIRNAVFVIGELRDPEGVNILLKWSECTDSRVRHEAATATEKIGGEQAAKLLLILADDKDPKVRNRAIVALGQIGTAEEVSDLVTISERHPDSLSTVVKTLGRLGGAASRDFLFAVLEDDRLLKEMGVPKKEVPELRILTLKAIAQIGDQISLAKLREYSERKATPARLLKRKDNLQATAASLLRRTDERKSPTVGDLTHQK